MKTILTLLKIETTSSREDNALYDISRSISVVANLGSDNVMLKNRPRIYKIKITTIRTNAIIYF